MAELKSHKNILLCQFQIEFLWLWEENNFFFFFPKLYNKMDTNVFIDLVCTQKQDYSLQMEKKKVSETLDGEDI